MKRIMTIALMAGLLASCGGSQTEPKTAEEVRAAIGAKRKQQADIAAEIKSLEATLLKLDPEARQQARAKAVIAQPVALTRFQHFIQVQGTVEAEENVMVNAKMGGIIDRVYVKVGDQVRRGQVLVEGDNSVYEQTIAELNTSLALAKTLWDKQRALWDQKIGTEVQYLSAKNNYESLRDKLATVRAQMDLNKITSPISGVVDEVNIKEGEAASPGFGVIRVVNMSDLKITARVADSYVPRIRKGDKVIVRLPDVADTLRATISYVGRVVDPVTRTVGIEVRLPAGSSLLRPNMIAIIAINDKSLDDALVIDENVTQRTDAGTQVFVVAQADGHTVARARQVQLGLRYAGRVQVTQGLQPGDKLITVGYQDLVDGQRVVL